METHLKDTALLVMDVQEGIVAMLPGADGLIANIASAIAAARSQGIPVIYVVVGFRDGGPEISANNKSFMASKARLTGTNMADFMTVHPQVAPHAGDITVVKRRVSAFTGSDLEVVLRALEIRHVVLSGFSTSGVVLSTTREAADKDYQITILSDCCADGDAEVHRVLTEKVFPRQAEVLTAAEWAKL